MSEKPDHPAALDRAAIERLPYRSCVGIMLLDPDSRVFVARRIDRHEVAPPIQSRWKAVRITE